MNKDKCTPPTRHNETNHFEEELDRVTTKSFEVLEELEKLAEKNLNRRQNE